MASFRQRNDTWRAEISVNGIRESATFDTKAQARAWASKRETQLREQSHGKLPDHSFLEAIERYLSEVSVKRKLMRMKSSEWLSSSVSIKSYAKTIGQSHN